MPSVGFNLDKFMKRIERQRIVEPGDVELLAELLTEALAREKRLRAALEEQRELWELAAPLLAASDGKWSVPFTELHDPIGKVDAALAPEEEHPT
jgi:hypothetical protein